MVRKVQVHLLDDLDGSAADETVRFALDGQAYEIDVSDANADVLRKALAKYIVAGRRPATGIVTGRRNSHRAVPVKPSSERNQAVRDWARQAGIDVNERGRIPASVLEQYDTANAR